jgi:hypothetical protein
MTHGGHADKSIFCDYVMGDQNPGQMRGWMGNNDPTLPPDLSAEIEM